MRSRARAVRSRAFRRFGPRMGPVLTANFFAHFSHPRNLPIGGYWPIGEEADVRPLLRALAERGYRVALPRVVDREGPLRFLLWHPGDPLEAGYAGIQEPRADGEEIVPRAVLVPLLAFDRDGRRLGYGGGFYDRTLADLRRRGPVEAIGVAFADQEVDSLPDGAHDERLDWIMTETGCRRAGEGAKAT